MAAAIDSGFVGLRNAAAVTPSDSADLTYQARALYVGTTGNVAIVTPGGLTVTLVGVPAGTLLQLLVNRVMATNTTASNIVAFW